MRSLATLALLLCPSTALAQLQNEFEIYPADHAGGTQFFARGTFGSGEGSVFQDYPPSHQRGIGDEGTSCRLTGFEFVISDGDGQTPETFEVAVRRGDATGPALGAAGLIGAVSVNTPSAAAGPIALEITVSLTTPLTVPCDDHLYVGTQLPADPDWPGDGVANAVYVHSQDPALAGMPSHAWQIVGSPDTGQVSKPGDGTLNMSVRTLAPVLNMGVNGSTGPVDPDFGPAGMYPDVGRARGAAHGLIFRVRDGVSANGTAILLFGTGFDAPFSLGSLGIAGNLWMSASLVGQIASGTFNVGGECVIFPAWMDAGQLERFAGVGTVAFQAITFKPGPADVRMSNAVSAPI
jgi:hypothetical protein